MKFFIVHGTEGSPDGNWFPWLKKELESQGHEVYVPKFPTPANQSLDIWLNVFEEYIDKVDEDSVLIGHSLGPAFILSVLERLDVKVKGAILVAGFISFLGSEHFDSLNESFIKKNFDWDTIKRNCEKFFVINSKDDPFVPYEIGVKLADRLDVSPVILENAGHINEQFGFKKFELILDYIGRLE